MQRFLDWLARLGSTRLVAVFTAIAMVAAVALTSIGDLILYGNILTESVLKAVVVSLLAAPGPIALGMSLFQRNKRAEKALRESEQHYRDLLNAIPDSVLVFDRQGVCQECRTSDTRWLSNACEAVVGESVERVFPPNVAPRIRTGLEQVLSTSQTLVLEYDLGETETPQTLEVRLVATSQATVLCIVRDVTLQRQAQVALEAERATLARRVDERTAELRNTNAELARAMRARDEFLATVSHELRTPLTAILAFADLLLRQYGALNERQARAVDSIQQSGQHLLSLIDDVIDVARIETGDFALTRSQVDVATLVEACTSSIADMVKAKGQTLLVATDPQVSTLYVDARRLRQMLTNLLDNAVKFTLPGGEIGLDIHADAAECVVHFSVWDTGIGIAEKDIARLFQPFMQVDDSSLTRQYEGTGLGLALVHRLAQLHGGCVGVESALGEGSRFTVSLPWIVDPDTPVVPYQKCVRRGANGAFVDHPTMPLPVHREATRQRDAEGSAWATPSASGPILVVEDDESSRFLLSDYLRDQGFQVVVAEDGEEALRVAAVVHPRLVLMDIRMPRMDGLTAIAQLRKMGIAAETPIIALTALSGPKDEARCLAAGADLYLTKPIDLRRLLAEIRDLTS